MLGVNESTLRRWADTGQIRSFRTPGGHRRFSESDIRLLMAGRPRVRSDNHYQSLSNLALTRIRRRLQHPRGPEPDWTTRIDEAGRMHLRATGRRLVDLTTEYLGRPRGRSRVVDEARTLGGEYGVELARNHLSLREAVEAFTFFRRSLGDTAKQVAQKENLSAEETAQAWELIHALGDEVLVALTDSYERARNGS
jgi:excisionase family DNA binding protein